MKLTKRIFCLVMTLPFVSSAQPTYFGSASNPADNGTLNQSNVSVTAPGSMQNGDLVILIGQVRTSSSDITMSNEGGQNWQRVNVTVSATNLSIRVYWCRFNGTWDGDPSMAFLSTTSTTVVMHVFRPTATTKTWALDQNPATAAYAAPTTPFNVVRAGITTVNPNTVTLAIFGSVDDNTWAEGAGAFDQTGGTQYRNIAGTDQSMTFAHYIAPIAFTGTGDATWQQATLGGDLGATAIITWYEYSPSKTGVPWNLWAY